MRRRSIALAAVLITAGLIIGLTVSSYFGFQSNGFTGLRPGAAKQVSEASVDVLSKFSAALVEVVEVVRPSVVNISSSRVIPGRQIGPGPFFNDPLFRRFFGDELFRHFDTPSERTETSLGSGIIVDERGYILTNNHVIKNAEEIVVTLYDKREFKGKVIGTDPKTDLAVIKIDAGDLPVARRGDSDSLKVGEMVIAVGTPYGLTHTVTTGIVSAKGRSNVRISDYEDFIQTDAAINPGNSGGPLINIRGEVVGINTAIFSTTGGYQGIGFAIPISMANSVMESLIKEGKVTRGWLGVTIQPVTKELAKQFKIEVDTGAIVSDVVEGSPAEKGGIKRGDVILSYDGKEVSDSLALRNMVAATRPGAEVEAKVLRDKKELTLTIKIGELQAEQMVAAGEFDNALKGVHVQDITPEIREKLGISGRIRGVVVTYSEREVGLKGGDVILEVDKEPVDNLKEYNEAVSKIPAGQDVLLLVYRDGGIFYLPISGE